jgi:predicted amidophosphoribosyltransferase
MTIDINGNWRKGLAFDVHTLSSTYLGVDEYGHNHWDSTRSEMGELVYQLKYRDRKANVEKIVDLISKKIKGLETFDAIIPIPPSNRHRATQPVIEIAKELGRRKRVKVLDILEKESTDKEIKNVDDPKERKALLKKAMKLSDDHDISGKKVLLFDDLYRSGVTLEVATDLLYRKAKVDTVCVLTLTKTRSNT